MNRRNFLKMAGMSALAFTLRRDTGVADETVKGAKPNILFLISDDQSWHSGGFAGDSVLKTPNLDHLAASGVVFSRAAVTTSICMVSRASMLTGQWLTRMGGARVTPNTWPDTWPARLRAAGYYGGHVGKIHVKGQTGEDYDFWVKRMKYGRSPEADTSDAVRFLKTRPKDRPFFLEVAYAVPHADDNDRIQYVPSIEASKLYSDVSVPVPETAADEYWQRLPELLRDSNNESRKRWAKRFDTAEKYQTYTKNYLRLISDMDRSIGEILKTLDETNSADNTIVVFIGDNGYFLGEHGLADKWYAYEESLRVPLIVYDPRLPPERRGKCCDELVLNVDLAPTFCALAGITPPAAMQGRNFYPLCRGESIPNWRKDFLYQFKWSSETMIPASEAVCSKDWKYIRWVVSGTEELFDLRKDPHETNNLVKDPAFAATLTRLRERCAELKKEVGGKPLEELNNMPYGG